MQKIASVILCAGEASRMGKVKALLPWREKSLLAHAVDAARGAGITNIVVAVGAHAELILAETRALAVETALNEVWANGIGSSIKHGVSYARQRFNEPEAILIQLADQPLVDAACLLRLLKAAEPGANLIVAAEYNHSAGVPVYFPKSFFEPLLKIADQTGAKPLLMKYRDQLKLVAMPEAALDIDTPEQYENL